VTWFLAGSSSFSWHDLAGLGDNHLATLIVGYCISDTRCSVATASIFSQHLGFWGFYWNSVFFLLWSNFCKCMSYYCIIHSKIR